MLLIIEDGDLFSFSFEESSNGKNCIERFVKWN